VIGVLASRRSPATAQETTQLVYSPILHRSLSAQSSSCSCLSLIVATAFMR